LGKNDLNRTIGDGGGRAKTGGVDICQTINLNSAEGVSLEKRGEERPECKKTTTEEEEMLHAKLRLKKGRKTYEGQGKGE